MGKSGTDGDVVLVSGALGASDLFVLSMKGREALSSLYEFEFIVQTATAFDDAKLDALFTKMAYVAFGNDRLHKVHGVLRLIEMQSAAEASPVVYRMILVPQLWYATLTFRSKVFQDKTVVEIVTDVLEDLGFSASQHFDIQATAKHPKREFTVQYQETDFAFISRLLEYEGMFYYFEHGDEFEKLVVGDANTAFVPLSGYDSIGYNPTAGITDELDTIQSLSRERRMVPKTVVVRDYNYRMPSLALTADSPIDPKGHGLQVFYGEHFKDQADGKRLAKIRGEEALVRKDRYVGLGRVRGLAAGHKFTLQDHPIAAMEQAYYVSEIEHTVAQSGALSSADAAVPGRAYSNRFVAIPASIAFRPQRVTPKPSIAGVMHANIDAASKGTAAPIDDQGRYKVVLPYDVGGKTGGKASRWIRMAQHGSGPGYGSHLPLHAGAEVILVHIDGDPDRPIISAAVPNPMMGTTVTSANATQSVIQTHAGIHFHMEDDA